MRNAKHVQAGPTPLITAVPEQAIYAYMGCVWKSGSMHTLRTVRHACARTQRRWWRARLSYCRQSYRKVRQPG